MKRINWFDANRSMSNEIVDYMRCYVWKKELNEKFRKEQEQIDHALACLDNLKGSIHEDKIPEMRTTWLARKAELEIQRTEQIAKEATYAPSDADKELKKGLSDYKKGKADAVKVLQKWFLAHGLALESDCYLFDEIFNAAGEKDDIKTYVQTDGKVVTGFNNTNCYKMVFMKCYEHMVNAGTIKPAQIPPLIAEKYAPKKKSSKKANKKATKAA